MYVINAKNFTYFLCNKNAVCKCTKIGYTDTVLFFSIGSQISISIKV
jgi:hypothetical protein